MTPREIKNHYQKMDESVNRATILSQLAGCSVSDIQELLGLKQGKERMRPPRINKDEFFELYYSGLTDREITEQLCVGKQVVATYRLRHGLKPNKRRAV